MSGGGGSAGSIDYPAYLENIHSHWLTHNTLTVGSDTMTYSVSDLMETAQTGNSPYFGATPTDVENVFFDPASGITDYTTAISPYELLWDFHQWDVDTAYTTYSTDTAVNAVTDAFTDSLNDEIDEQVMPSFLAGHANMNSVMGSAFVIGRAMIANTKAREIAKVDASLRTTTVLQRLGIKMEWNRMISVLGAENARLYLAAKHEEQESSLDYAAKDAIWDLEMYQYGFRAMAAVAGTANPSVPSHKPSVLGGAISGAAAGAMIGAETGTPHGVAVGAAIGAGVGIASTL
jgi:hypothetical protein